MLWHQHDLLQISITMCSCIYNNMWQEGNIKSDAIIKAYLVTSWHFFSLAAVSPSESKRSVLFSDGYITCMQHWDLKLVHIQYVCPLYWHSTKRCWIWSSKLQKSSAVCGLKQELLWYQGARWEFTELNTSLKKYISWPVTVWYTVCNMSICALSSWKINTYNQEPVMVFMHNTKQHFIMWRIPLKKFKYKSNIKLLLPEYVTRQSATNPES